MGGHAQGIQQFGDLVQICGVIYLVRITSTINAGVVCIIYCVIGLKVVNATAQAFAEKSPLVIISGSPGIAERRKNSLLHRVRALLCLAYHYSITPSLLYLD